MKLIRKQEFSIRKSLQNCFSKNGDEFEIFHSHVYIQSFGQQVAPICQLTRQYHTKNNARVYKDNVGGVSLQKEPYVVNSDRSEGNTRDIQRPLGSARNTEWKRWREP